MSYGHFGIRAMRVHPAATTDTFGHFEQCFELGGQWKTTARSAVPIGSRGLLLLGPFPGITSFDLDSTLSA